MGLSSFFQRSCSLVIVQQSIANNNAAQIVRAAQMLFSGCAFVTAFAAASIKSVSSR